MKYIRKFNEDVIRISCASLAQIKINDKYLLLLNKRRFDRGELTYSPVGGGLEFNDNAISFLSKFTQKFEKGNDLRLFINRDSYNEFLQWFKSGKERESGIERELIEELVNEEHLFDSLRDLDFKSTYLRTGIFPYDEGCRIFEIYNVKFTKEKEDYILENISNTHFKLFTLDEITSGKSIDGEDIAPSSKTII